MVVVLLLVAIELVMQVSVHGVFKTVEMMLMHTLELVKPFLEDVKSLRSIINREKENLSSISLKISLKRLEMPFC